MLETARTAPVALSANLTEHAIRANMELGVLIPGGPHPRRLRDHFNELILNGTLGCA